MKKVYSHENLTMVHSAQNLLQLEGLECVIKNEHYGSGGHVGLEAVPIELWVKDDATAPAAITLLENNFSANENRSEWTCKNCGEINEGSFDICWKCQHSRD